MKTQVRNISDGLSMLSEDVAIARNAALTEKDVQRIAQDELNQCEQIINGINFIR